MTNVTIYGKQSSNYEYLKMMLKENANKAGINFNLTEINNYEQFIRENIEQIPTVKIDDAVIPYNNKDINNYIQRVNELMLKKDNYGELLKIIVPLDFSETSENALNYSIQYAKYFNCCIHLLHAHKPAPTESESVESQTILNSENRIKEYKSNINESNSYSHNTLNVDSELKVGFAGDIILSKADNTNNSLVILGSSGNSGTLKTIFGSVSTKVASNSNAPVLIIPPYSTFKPIKRIAFYSDNVELDVYAVEYLSKVAKKFDAEIHIIHVNYEKSKGYMEFDLLEIWKSYYPKKNIFVHFLEENDTVKAINQYCIEKDINMLSMCRNENSLYKNLFQTNLTKRMTINTEIPLLILNKNL